MEKFAENKPDLDLAVGSLANTTAATPILSVGSQLRAAREQLGLSVEDVVAKIKLASRQIIALEADDFAALPETAFMRGFVRSYAKLLQLDPQPLLDALPAAKGEQVKVTQLHVDAPFPTERTQRRQNINLLIAALLVALVIAGFALWPKNASQPVVVAPVAVVSDAALVETQLPFPDQVEILDGSGVADAGIADSGVSAASVVAAASVAQAAPVIPAPAMPAVAATLPAASSLAKPVSALRLVFDKEAWVEIKDQSGKALSNKVNLAGSELRVEGVAPFTLVVGHAVSVHLFYREKPVDMKPFMNAGSEVARMTLE
jgi:cytoskeleton protein RodZ